MKKMKKKAQQMLAKHQKPSWWHCHGMLLIGPTLLQTIIQHQANVGNKNNHMPTWKHLVNLKLPFANVGLEVIRYIYNVNPTVFQFSSNIPRT